MNTSDMLYGCARVGRHDRVAITRASRVINSSDGPEWKNFKWENYYAFRFRFYNINFNTSPPTDRA
jgi:hypothetical protein